MKKRLISGLLIVLITISALLCLGGCKEKDDNFPVTIGHTELSEKPKNVAVLSDNLADIILYMDEFQSQICAVSDSCTQKELTDFLPSVGSETNPSIDALERAGAKYVITDKELSSIIKDKLSDNDITLLTFKFPETTDQLKTVYRTLGTFFGGSPDGKQTGVAAYDRFISTINSAAKEAEGSKILKTICYLYLNETGKLCSYNNTDCNGMLLNFVGATNVSANFNNKVVEVSILGRSNPDFIFYDSPEVLDYISNNSELQNLKAIKNGNSFLIPRENFERLGETFINTQKDIIAKVHGIGTPATPDEAEPVSHAANYGITIRDGVSYKHGDSDPEILIIQQRLVDLGYLVFDADSAPTEYYGDKSKKAIEDFQKANNLESTGIINRTTLEVLFLSTTLSTSGNTVTPPPMPETEPTEPDTTAPTGSDSAVVNPDYMNKTYDIDLSENIDYGIRIIDGEESPDIHKDVMAIQERLHDLGFYIPGNDFTGYTDYYGNVTKGAMEKFEAANGLEVDGFADYYDLLKLFGDDVTPAKTE